MNIKGWVTLGFALLTTIAPACADKFDDMVNRVRANEARDRATFEKIYHGKPVQTRQITQPGAIQQPGTIKVPTAKIRPIGKFGIVSGKAAIKEMTDKGNPCYKRYVVGSDCLFEFGKSTLTVDATETLKYLQPLLVAQLAHPMTVEGHTDSIGTDADNQKLSEQRAHTVKCWLIAHRCALDSATEVGYGERKPVAPNEKNGKDNPPGRALNRRVVIVVNTCETLPAAK